MIAGRIDLTRRALERAITAAAGSVLGVSAGDVSVRLADERGALAVAIETPATVRRGPGLVTRAAAWRDEIRTRAVELTGLDVRDVRIRITTLESEGSRR